MNFDDKTPPLWHAFNSLDISNTGSCSKSTLKVLTFNVASALCVLNADKALDEICETETITFEDYLNFLRAEVFVQLQDTDCLNANLDLSQVDQVCWYVCSKKYLERTHKHMNSGDVQKLWLVFNFLSEKDDSDLTVYPLVIHRQEVAMVIECMQMGLTRMFDKDKFDLVFGTEHTIPFERFLDLIEHKYCEGLDLETVHVLVVDVYEKYITEVYKKGMMYKRSPKFNNYHERYFVLTPKFLSYYSCREKKDCRGSVSIEPSVRVMMVTSTDNKSKPHRIQLMTPNRTYELSAHDNKDKVEWLHAIDNAIKNCNNPYTPQKKGCLTRRRKRREERERQRKEAEKQQEIEMRMKRMKEDLERERILREQLQVQLSDLENLRAMTRNKLEEIEQQRQELEGKLHEETSQRGEDEKRLRELAEEREGLERQLLEEATVSASLKRQMEELQGMRRELQRLWKEETQAREDEEKVRQAAVNALREEMEKREEMERLKEELMKKSEEEQQRNQERVKVLEEGQTRALREAEDRLRVLEMDRREKEAQLKIQEQELCETERAKQEMKEKLAESERNQNAEAITKINMLKELLKLDPNAAVPNINSHRGKGALTLQELDVKAQLFRNNSAPESSPSFDYPKAMGQEVLLGEVEKASCLDVVVETGGDEVFVEEDREKSGEGEGEKDGQMVEVCQSEEIKT